MPHSCELRLITFSLVSASQHQLSGNSRRSSPHHATCDRAARQLLDNVWQRRQRLPGWNAVNSLGVRATCQGKPEPNTSHILLFHVILCYVSYSNAQTCCASMCCFRPRHQVEVGHHRCHLGQKPFANNRICLGISKPTLKAGKMHRNLLMHRSKS